MTLKHRKNLTVADGGDTNVVQPSNWNDDHIVAGGFDLPAETVTPPPANTVRLFGKNVGGRMMPAFEGPSGLDTAIQPSLARNKVSVWLPAGNATTATQLGLAAATGGTATGANVATTNILTATRRLEYLVTTAATTAVAFWQSAGTTGNQFFRGTASLGGYHVVLRFGGATGMTTATHRFFAGMSGGTVNAGDSEPSTRTDAMGVGYDSADANWHLIHRDGSAVATKINLGASFPRQTADRSKLYELALFCPPGGTSVFYEFTDLLTGAVASGEITTNMPAASTLLKVMVAASVGGTSSVIGLTMASAYIETDY